MHSADDMYLADEVRTAMREVGAILVPTRLIFQAILDGDAPAHAK